MPDKNVQIEGVGVVAFPDSMSDEDIGKVIQRQHPELSSAPPIAAPPLAPGLGNTGADVRARALNNLPGSIVNAAKAMVTLPMGGAQDIANKDGSMPAITNPIKAATDFLAPFIHPQESFANDPVGTTGAYIAPIQMLTHPAVRAAAGGAAKAAVNEIRPGLSNIDLIHPFRTLPDLYDAASRIASGGKAALRDYQGRGDIPDAGGPFRVNPNTVDQFGGSAQPSGGTPTGANKPTGWTASTAKGEAATPAIKFQPSAATASRMKYGGPTNPRAGMPTGSNPSTGWTPPQKGLTPPPSSPGFPDPGEGFKTKPGVVKSKFTPNPANSGPQGAAPARTKVGRNITPPPGEEGVDPEPAVPASQTPAPRGSMSATEEAAHTDYGNAVRDAKNAKMAQYFRAKGIAPETVQSMRDIEYNEHLKTNGFRPSTGKGYSRDPAAARQQVIDLMRENQGLTPPPGQE
jgi:hypothetical protein